MPKKDTRDFDERYATCFTDFAVKTMAGLIIGSMVGSFFFKGLGFKRWPMYLGGGFGFGSAYTNCESSLNDYLLAMNPKACVIKKKP